MNNAKGSRRASLLSVLVSSNFEVSARSSVGDDSGSNTHVPNETLLPTKGAMHLHLGHATASLCILSNIENSFSLEISNHYHFDTVPTGLILDGPHAKKLIQRAENGSAAQEER